MKKIVFIMTLIGFAILMSLSVAADETTEEYMSYLATQQRYDTVLTQAHFNNNLSQTEVNPQSGVFMLRQNDYMLPGKAGLDLNIGRIYRSGDTTRYETKSIRRGLYYVSETITDYTADKFYSFYEQRYNLGTGMRFSFPTIQVIQTQSNTINWFLHTESGNVYSLKKTGSTYEIEGYELDDIKIYEDSATNPKYNYASNYEPGYARGKSKYIVENKNGTKMYFSDNSDSSQNVNFDHRYEGRILGIVDKYGNEIKFEYSDIGASFSSSLSYKKRLITRITDTSGRQVRIEYLVNQNYITKQDGIGNSFDVKITTPENQMIIYKKTSMLYKDASASNSTSGLSIKERMQSVYTLEDADQYGVNNNYGEQKYYYWYEQTPYVYSTKNNPNVTQNNMYENMSIVKYCETNQVKIIKYQDAVKRLYSAGSVKYRRVLEDIDVLHDGGNINYASVSNNVSCSGKIEKRYSYHFDGMPNGQEPTASSSDTYLYVDNNIVYPMINFNTGSTIYPFSTTSSTGYSSWKLLNAGGMDGGPCMYASNNSDSVRSLSSLYVAMAQPGTLSFDVKFPANDATTFTVYRQDLNSNGNLINFPIDVFTMSGAELGANEWQKKKIPLPAGRYLLFFQYEGTKSVYVDNVSVEPQPYVTTIKNELDMNGTLIKYVYNINNLLVQQHSISDDHYEIEDKKYDDKNMLSISKKIRYERTGDFVNSVPIILEEEFVYDVYGNLTSYVGSNDKDAVWSYTYDSTKYNKLTSRIVMDGTQIISKSEYELNNLGDVIKEIKTYVGNEEDEFIITDFAYDDKGNLIRQETRSTEDENQIFISHYEYGEIDDTGVDKLYLTRELKGNLNNPLMERKFSYEFVTGLMVTQTHYYNASGDESVTNYDYDKKYRVTAINYPDDTRDEYEYHSAGLNGDHNYIVKTKVHDKPSTAFFNSYNIYGNLIRTNYVDGNTTKQMYNCEYDSRNNIIKEIDGNGNIVRYEYDGANRLKKKSYCDSNGIEKSAVNLSYQNKYDQTGDNVFSDVRKVVTSNTHWIILKNDGTVWTLRPDLGAIKDGETNYPMQISGIAGAIDVAAGNDFSIVLLSDGTMRSWGINHYGQLGSSGYNAYSTNISGVREDGYSTYLSGIKSVFASENTAYAISNSGYVYVWGRVHYTDFRGYQLIAQNAAKTLGITEGGPFTRASDIAFGYGGNTTYIVRKDVNSTLGDVYVWGYNPYINGMNINGIVFGGSVGRVANISAVHSHLSMVRESTNYNRQIYNYGNLWFAKNSLGNDFNWWAPDGNVAVADIIESHNNAMILKDDGSVLMGGTNGFGQLGNDISMISQPVQMNLPGIIAQGIGLANNAGFVIDQSGQLLITGYNPSIDSNMYIPYILETPGDDSTYPENAVSMVTVTDEEGYVAKYYLDVEGCTVAVDQTPDKQNYYRTKYQYDALGNQVKTVDAKGAQTVFEYDMLSRLIKKTDALGNQTTYQYNGANMLSEKTETGDKKLKHFYDDAGRLTMSKVGKTAEIDTKYTYQSYTYDLANNTLVQKTGRVANGQNTVDLSTSFAYNARGGVETKYTTVEDNVVSQTHYQYDHKGKKTREYIEWASPLGQNQTASWSTDLTYDDFGRVTEQISKIENAQDADGIIKQGFVYDQNGNITEMRSYKSDTTYHATNFVYDWANRVVTHKEPAANNGQRQTTYTYDKKGNTLTRTLYLGNKQLQESFAYNGRGQVISHTSAMGNTTRFGYDQIGNKTIEVDGRYASYTLEAAPGLRYSYDVLGRPSLTSLFDGSAAAVLESRQYDGRGNVAKIVSGANYTGTAQDPGVKMEYDASENMIKYTPASIANTNHIGSTMTYTGAGQLLSKTDYVDAQTGYTTTYEYYKNGLLKSVQYPDSTVKENYEYDITGMLYNKKTDRDGGVTEVYKNIFGLPYKTVYPDGKEERAEYDYYMGLILAFVDRKNRRKKYQYNNRNQLVAAWTEEPESSQSNAPIYKVGEWFTYDDWDNVIQHKQGGYIDNAPTGNGSIYNTVSYEYNNAFQVHRAIGSNGSEVEYGYDAGGNVVIVKQKVDTNYEDIKRYEYDPIKRLTKDITLVENTHIEATGLTTDSQYPSRKKVVTSYVYDNSGNIKKKTDARGNSTTYEYTPDSKIAKVTGAATGAVSYSYDFAGNLKSETNALGSNISYGYDSCSRLISKIATSPNGNLVWNYGYDVMGNLVTERTPDLNSYNQQNGTNKSISYTYDNMNRMILSKNAEGQVLQAVKYDDLGRVIKKTEGNNYFQNIDSSFCEIYEYNDFDQLIQKTDVLGNVYTYAYDLAGNVKSITDPGDNMVAYTHTNGRLTKTVYPDGGEVGYAYDKKGRAVSQSMKQSSAVTISESYVYNAFDKPYQMTDAAQKTVISTYDANGNLTKMVDKRGNATTYQYDKDNRVTSVQAPISGGMFSKQLFAYDVAGNLTQKTITGNDASSKRVSEYVYYQGMQLLQVTTDAGQEINYEYDNAGNVSTTRTLRTGQGSAKVYDVTTRVFDQYGRVKEDRKLIEGSVIDGGNGTHIAKTTYEYDVVGNKIEEKTPMAFATGANAGEYTTAYYYDAMNRISHVSKQYAGQPVSTVYTYDDLGNILSVQDEQGNTTSYTYDAMSRVKTVTNAQNVVTHFNYDLAGNKIKETYANGVEWNYEYDVMNRLSITKDANATVTAKIIYDANGNVTKTIDGRGYASASSDASRYGVVYTYNAMNLPVTITNPMGNAVQYTYNQFGERTSVTDGMGGQIQYVYNSAGQLTSVTDQLGNATEYTYDVSGNKTSMTDASGNVTRYEYGSFGMLLSYTDAKEQTQSYLYNMLGYVRQSVDKNGNTTVYDYDSRNRITNQSVILKDESAAQSENIIAYQYDAMGNRTQMTDSSGTYTYAYDSLYRLTSINKDSSLQIAYQYDGNSNVSQVSYGGISIGYQYDTRNRLSAVTNGGLTYAGYQYDQSGNLVLTTNQMNGVSEQRQYDKAGRITKIKNAKSGSVISEYDYTYNAAGMIQTKTDATGTTGYGYDLAGRLVTATLPGQETHYEYDNVGNRAKSTTIYNDNRVYVDNMSENVVQYTYNRMVTEYQYSPNNELITANENMYSGVDFVVARNTVHSYDNNGNQYMTSSGVMKPSQASDDVSLDGGEANRLVDTTRSEFDAFNRLKKISKTQGGQTISTSYEYNGDGLRTQKTVDDGQTSTTTAYLYDRQHVVAETNENGTATYVRGMRYIAKIGVSNERSYYLYNAHGDVVQMVDSVGTVRNRYEYDAFGESILSIEEVENTIRYAGEFYDASAGLYYLRARYYNPHVGRFISEDGQAYIDNTNPSTVNLYTYCSNDPINYIDPTGNSATAVVGLTAILIKAEAIIQIVGSAIIIIGATLIRVFSQADARRQLESLNVTSTTTAVVGSPADIFSIPTYRDAFPVEKIKFEKGTSSNSSVKGNTSSQSVSPSYSSSQESSYTNTTTWYAEEVIPEPVIPFNYNFPVNADGTYTIQSDQCLDIIAGNFGISVQNIIDWNAASYPSLLDNPGLVYPGWTLVIEDPNITMQRNAEKARIAEQIAAAEAYDAEVSAAWEAGYSSSSYGYGALVGAGVASPVIDFPYGDNALSYQTQIAAERDKAIPQSISIAETEESKEPTYIYRWTDVYDFQSLTPVPKGTQKLIATRDKETGKIVNVEWNKERKVDDKTLSFSLNPGKNGGGAWKTTIEAVNATGFLRATIDGGGHVSIVPTEQAIAMGFGTFEEWLSTYSTANSDPHFYTLLLSLLCSPTTDFSLYPQAYPNPAGGLPGFTVDSLIYNTDNEIVGYNPLGQGYVDPTAGKPSGPGAIFIPIIPYVLNKQGGIIGYNPYGPGYVDYSDRAAQIEGGAERATIPYAPFGGYVWNKYGEVIGYTSGASYTDTSDKASETRGGEERKDQLWMP